MTTRPAAVAGTFYPADKSELTSMINRFYSEAPDQPAVGKALIAPHAGFIYSGPVAASCYAPLAKRRNIIKKAVLLGPSHYVGFMGMAVPSVDHFETPLGKIEIDKELRNSALECEDVVEMDNAHLQEHSLEVHLPFLQSSLNDFTLLPLVVGQCPPPNVAALLEKVWGGPETLIIISTDLSHFKNYKDAVDSDSATARHIVQFEADKIDTDDACGSRPLKGLLYHIKDNMKVKLVDLRNSGDTAGGKERVVGYASFICDSEHKLSHIYSEEEKANLLKLARVSIAVPLGISEKEPDLAKISNVKTATFVTLKINGELRGCIGTLSAHRNLFDDIRHNARAAAFEDPRFPPVTAAEFSQLKISLSVLTPPVPFPVESEEDLLSKITPGVDGLILQDGVHRSTFLPSVWEELSDPREFVGYLKRKAGLQITHWSDTIKFQKYGAVVFSEKA